MGKLEEELALKIISRYISQESGSAPGKQKGRKEEGWFLNFSLTERYTFVPFAEPDPQHYGDSLWEGQGLGIQYEPSKERFTLSNLLCRCGMLGREIRKQICESREMDDK